MAMLFPTMFTLAVNLAVLASVFIKMMVDTMDKSQDGEEGHEAEARASDAVLCMLGFGVGEMVGSLAFGQITDKCKRRTTFMLNVVACLLAYTVLILYAVFYEFSFHMGLLMTFTWGVQDAGVACILMNYLGFQFSSKTAPFGVYKSLESLMIVVMVNVESTLHE